MKTKQLVSIGVAIVAALCGVMLLGALSLLAATQTDLIGPPGSESFGEQIVVLTNGNIVVADPDYDAPGPITDTGAVYLYNGVTGALISRLTGSAVEDQVGDSVEALSNGNYVVSSPYWDNGPVENAGAATWGNGTTGITGTISITNSLVGSTMDDRVGTTPALNNGNYVVSSPYWNNGAVMDAGAVTWGNGTTGITGVVSITNSLVGSHANDWVGGYIRQLSNGNYVVVSEYWHNDAMTTVGAATWGNGATGITGAVSITNSLVGSTTGDRVGSSMVFELSNGNYLVRSPYWDNGAAVDVGAVTWGNSTTGITGVVSITNSLVGSGGDIVVLNNGNYVVNSPGWDNGVVVYPGAVTWGNGTTGITGVVSITNSLVGSTGNGLIGSEGVVALSNGNYVVLSPGWGNGAAGGVGAVTWGNGTTGITGVVSITNSLVGSTTYDQIGYHVEALTNGNYVVGSPRWNNGVVTDTGAATWGNGAAGITGVVSATNSPVGSTAGDEVGDYVFALSNGNYVVGSPYWNNGAVAYVGAVTWGNGATGITGVVSITNSLVGGTTGDGVGNSFYFGSPALSNGNYVVGSPGWSNGQVESAGAATWGNGATGITGVVSITNSLVGSTENDWVGRNSILALSNGNYVVRSPKWDNGTAVDAGALTWGNGAMGITGVVSVTNSLVGSTTNDGIGDRILALHNGSYVVHSHYWDNGAAVDAGAITLGGGQGGTAGPITADNSVRGLAADGGWRLNFGYDYTHHQLVVGRPADKIVTLFRAVFGLSLSKSVTPTTNVPYHGVITYTVVLNNSGPVSDTTALITDTLPTGVTFGQWVEAPGDVIRNGNAITWTGTLTHSTVVTFTYTALHTGNYGDVITNTAYFSGAEQTGSAAAVFNVAPLKYTVIVDLTGAGSGIVSSTPAGINCGATCSAMFTAGSMVTLTATPLISSTFAGWSGDVVTTTNPIALMLNADKTVAATFALKTFVITPTAGANGSLTPGTPQTVNYSANQTFTITANNGYHIADVGVDGVSQGAVANYTFNNVTADHTITATFALNPPSGLSASNDSPTAFNQATTFTATTSSSVNVAYAWNFGDGNLGTGATVTHTYATAGTYTAIVTATNNAGILTATTTAYVTTNPIANAGSDQTARPGRAVRLDGSASIDPGHFLPLAYHWQQTSGLTVTLTGANQVTATFTAPIVTQTQALTFTLTVTNTQSIASLPDVIVITIAPYRIALPIVIKQ